MNSVYVVFARTDLKVGRMIRIMTRNRYNHVAISLDGMKTLCSFSRLYINHPLVGGFVEESPNRYLLSDKCYIKTVRIDVDNKTYAALKERVESMQRKSREYVYNYMSAAAYILGMRIEREHAYTCVEFVSDALERSGILKGCGGSRVEISELERALSTYGCREAAASEIFKCVGRVGWGSDVYLRHLGRIAAAKEALRRFGAMVRSA